MSHQITSKFSIGDTVWFLEDNKVESRIVFGIHLHIDVDHNLTETYAIREANEVGPEKHYHVWNASILFPSKQALLDSL